MQVEEVHLPFRGSCLKAFPWAVGWGGVVGGKSHILNQADLVGGQTRVPRTKTWPPASEKTWLASITTRVEFEPTAVWIKQWRVHALNLFTTGLVRVASEAVHLSSLIRVCSVRRNLRKFFPFSVNPLFKGWVKANSWKSYLPLKGKFY